MSIEPTCGLPGMEWLLDKYQQTPPFLTQSTRARGGRAQLRKPWSELRCILRRQPLRVPDSRVPGHTACAIVSTPDLQDGGLWTPVLDGLLH